VDVHSGDRPRDCHVAWCASLARQTNLKVLRLAREVAPHSRDHAATLSEIRLEFAAAVRKLSAITCLELSTAGPDWLGPCIAAWPALDQLSVGATIPDRGMFAPVVTALASAPLLRRLDLAAVSLNGWAAAILARTLPSLPCLTRLDVSSNFLTPSRGASALCAALPALPVLATLRLNGNADFFNADVADALRSGLRQLPKLSYHDLSVTNPQKDGLKTIAPSIDWAVLLEDFRLPDSKGCPLQAVADLICALPAHHRLRRTCFMTHDRRRISELLGVSPADNDIGPWPVYRSEAKHALAEICGAAIAEHVHAAPRHACIAAILLGEDVLQDHMLAVRAA
jgi:hypothetical protein